MRSCRAYRFMFGLFFISSCAPVEQPWPSSRFYVEHPAARPVVNSAFIEEAYHRVWQRALRRLSESRFALKSSDPEKGQIIVSLTDHKPEKWIDCGRVKRFYTRGTEAVSYEYSVAQSMSYLSAGSWRSASQPGDASGRWLPRMESTDRETSLQARAVSQFYEVQSGVRVDVVGRYRLAVRFSGTYRNEDRSGEVVETGRLPARTIVHAFRTHQHNTYNEGGFPVRCRSNGRLERELLALALP